MFYPLVSSWVRSLHVLRIWVIFNLNVLIKKRFLYKKKKTTKNKSLALEHTEMAQESTGGKQEAHIFCCFLNEAMYNVPLDFAT